MVLSQLDRILLERCLSGAEGAWDDFVERFLPLIVHVVNHTATLRFGSLPDAWRDDLVAEVLLSLVDNNFSVLRRFRGESSLGTYLAVVARRVAARKLAKMRRSEGNSTNRSAKESPNGKSTGNDDLLHVERVDQVETLLKRMPQREAQVIRLFHLEHCTYEEISSHLGIPENSIGPLLSRARNLMKALDAEDKTA